MAVHLPSNRLRPPLRSTGATQKPPWHPRVTA